MIVDEYSPPQRNALNGRFLKGYIPFNKGKKWDDYLDGRKRKRILKGLELGRLKKGDKAPCAGWNAKRVVYVDKIGIPHVFPSASAAGKVMGMPDRNIRYCCDKKRMHVHSIRWYWFEDDEWTKEIRI